VDQLGLGENRMQSCSTFILEKVAKHCPPMRYLLLTLLVIVSPPAFGRDKLDWKAIAAELKVAIPARATKTEVFSRKLEQWMSDLGMSIKIDHPRENSLYLFPFNIGSHASDEEFQKILARSPGVKNRDDFVKRYLEKERIDVVPFDQAEWDAKRHLNPRQRYRLFKGYCVKKTPIGMTREEIERDLGASSAPLNASSISYYVGADLGFGIDSLSVELSLKDGKITEYRFVGY
jgi:hypothetical protein